MDIQDGQDFFILRILSIHLDNWIDFVAILTGSLYFAAT
jgi:hypothetical protein